MKSRDGTPKVVRPVKIVAYATPHSFGWLMDENKGRRKEETNKKNEQKIRTPATPDKKNKNKYLWYSYIYKKYSIRQGKKKKKKTLWHGVTGFQPQIKPHR